MELVEEVSVDGEVLRVVPRSEMRALNLRHRSVGVVVRRSADRAVLAHRRAAWKDVWPGRWDVAFGGVCAAGESGVVSALRELAEEAGVVVASGALVRLGSGAYEDADVATVAEIFEVTHDGPFTFADGEVEEVRWVPFSGLASFLASHEHCPDSAAIGVPMLTA